MPDKQIYIALLRGINVGGHHKVPMAELRKTLGVMGFGNVQTLLNSGNVIFEGRAGNEQKLEKEIAAHLEGVFEFPIPVLVRKADDVLGLIDTDPFADIEVTKSIRLYVSFLKEEPKVQLNLPWTSEDKSYRIIRIQNRMICSVLDLSATSTPKGMDALEKLFGKDITTRNWNTLHRIIQKLHA